MSWTLHLYYGQACSGMVIRTDFENRTRPGERVAKRRRCKAAIGASHRINQNETMRWFKQRFDGIIR